MFVEGQYLGQKVVMTKTGKEKAIVDIYTAGGLIRVMGDVGLFVNLARGDFVTCQVETNSLVFASARPEVAKK